MTFKGEIHTDAGPAKAIVFKDCGATPTSFLDLNYARQHKIPLIPLEHSRALTLADGSCTSTRVTQFALVTLNLSGHIEQLSAYVAQLDGYSMVLGLPWLELHDVHTRWAQRSVTFDSDYCRQNCLHFKPPVTIYARGTRPRQPAPPPKRSEMDPRTSNLDVQMVSAASFLKITQRKNHDFIIMDRRDFDSTKRLSLSAVTSEDFEKFMRSKPPMPESELLRQLPERYHPWKHVFSKTLADVLPPHRPTDHTIELKPDAKLPYKRPYNMSRDELAAVKKYIDEHLEKGFIRPSKSSVASPVLLARKPGGGLRFCVDYRTLNELTIKNRYPIPLIRDTLDRLCQAKYFTKLDIIAAFNKLRIAPGHEWKTAFTTSFGLFEYLVMPFGLCNAPSSFQSYINDQIQDFLNDFCVAYLDDILIYSNTKEEHEQHVKRVLERLDHAGLQVDIGKCEFSVQEVKYLGLIVTTNGLRMDPEKVDAVVNWQIPHKLRDVQAFLGFAGFYRRFIHRFSSIVAALTRLTKKGVTFDWDARCQRAFDRLKDAFTRAPILIHFDPTRETWIETDASDWATAGILSQMIDGTLHPVAFFSHKMSPAECNYEIYDKELMAIVNAFEEWRPELMSVDKTQVLTDHKSLEWFMTTKQLNRRQARWAEFLSQFNFVIRYRPGKQGTKPDSLTRRSQDLPTDTSDPRRQYQFQTILKRENLTPGMSEAIHSASTLPLTCADFMITPEADHDLASMFTDAYADDDTVRAIVTAKQEGQRLPPRDFPIEMSRIEYRDHRIWIHDTEDNDRPSLFVPEKTDLRTRLMKVAHDLPESGHGGRSHMLAQLKRYYYWPNMIDSISSFIKDCFTCKESKVSNRKYHGLLRPLQVPQQPWRQITIDYVVGLPPCIRHNRTYRHVLVVVDRLTKRRHLIPVVSLETEELAEAFELNVWKLHGYPEGIVSDRGRQFVSHFWKRLCQRLGVTTKLSTAHHPETDGQSEVTNAWMEQYIRGFINYAQDNWVDLLPRAEFFANNHDSETTGISPFYAETGFHPRTSLEPPADLSSLPHTRNEQRHADSIVERIHNLNNHLQQEMLWAQEQQAKYANRSRTPAPELRVGDKVWLDARYITTERTMKKLDYKKIGPYKIKRVIRRGAAYELDLPRAMLRKGLHPVFHPWLLHLHQGRQRDNTTPIEIQRQGDEQPVEEWHVHAIVDSRREHNGEIFYRVDWGSQDPSTWEPSTNLEGAQDAVADFHHRYPQKPKPAGYTFPENWTPDERED